MLSLGFWHIYDAYWLKKHSRSTFRTPEALKNFMSRMGEKNLLLFSFLSGGMFSLVKAPCVGAIYLSLLSILATKTDMTRGTVYMGIYNLGLLLPVIGLGLLLAFGLSPSKVTEFREKWRVEIRLITGFILIISSSDDAVQDNLNRNALKFEKRKKVSKKRLKTG